MSIEAMKRWLASFEGYRRELNDGQPCDAEKELLQAIEQAQKQEPVAWQVMVEDEAMKEFPIKDMAHDWCVHQKLSGSSYSYWIRPLYTSPPQRQPLTHEQRFDLLTKFEDLKNKWEAPAILIDMVEAAHGIKGEA